MVKHGSGRLVVVMVVGGLLASERSLGPTYYSFCGFLVGLVVVIGLWQESFQSYLLQQILLFSNILILLASTKKLISELFFFDLLLF